MKRFVAALVIAGSLTAAPAAAQLDPFFAYPEQIRSFDSNVTLTRENFAEVSETIVYDFGRLQRHGIFRDIPTRQKDDQGNTFYRTLMVTGVFDQNGQKRPYEDSSGGGAVHLKIGDPDKTISGVHTYVINYRLGPEVRQGNGADLFDFNVTGNDWDVPIRQASVTVTFQGQQAIANKCYTGVVRSTASECTITPDPAATKPLPPEPLGRERG